MQADPFFRLVDFVVVILGDMLDLCEDVLDDVKRKAIVADARILKKLMVHATERQVEAATWKLQVEDRRLTPLKVGNKHEGAWRERRDDEKDDLKHAHAEGERLRQEADENDRSEKRIREWCNQEQG